MTDIVTTTWSEVDANNNQFPPEGWPAGMLPNAVEPSARMNMAGVKRFWNRVNPVYLTTGGTTTDTYVVTPTTAIGGYGLFEEWNLRPHVGNQSTSPTISISGFPPTPIKKYSASSVTALASGDINAFRAQRVYWDGTQFILREPGGTGNINVTGSSIPQNGLSLAGPDILGISTASTLRGVFEANGALLLGGLTARLAQSGTMGVQFSGTQGVPGGPENVGLIRFNGTNATGSPNIQFGRSRSGTLGTNTIVQSGDRLGAIFWEGADGSGYTIAAQITADVDGTPGASADMPGRLVFSTTPDGAGAVTERLRIDNAGLFTFTGTILETADRGLTFSNQTSAAAAQAGTLLNAPAAGNPGFWLKVIIGGVNYSIPCWAG